MKVGSSKHILLSENTIFHNIHGIILFIIMYVPLFHNFVHFLMKWLYRLLHKWQTCLLLQTRNDMFEWQFIDAKLEYSEKLGTNFTV